MHCASCERVVGDALRKLPGVEEVEVSVRKGKAGLRVADTAPQPDLIAVNAELKPFGYQILSGEAKRSSVCELPGTSFSRRRRWLEALSMVLAVALVAKLLYPMFSKLVPSVTASGSFFALFALGIVASVSTCLASTGAFLLAYSSEGKGRAKTLWIQLGRVLSFVVGGAFLGALGGALPTGTLFYGLMALAFGLGFAAVGLHLLDLSPSLASRGIKLPSRLNGFADDVAKRDGKLTPFLIGVVTFILPCGFTQTAQALALASGSATRGALLMLAFALGTLPILTGLTWFGSVATLKHRFVRLTTGALLLLFAFGQLDGGLTVLGSPVTLGGLADRTASVFKARTIPTVNAQEQVVSMTVAYGAFSPNRFTIKKGVPVRWEIYGVDVSGCASTLISPKLGVNQALNPGINVILFTPKSIGVIPFSCGMGMIRGSFNVVE
jgi:sulfite exporter TauE/SafE/copper chaperone CopZ